MIDARPASRFARCLIACVAALHRAALRGAWLAAFACAFVSTAAPAQVLLNNPNLTLSGIGRVEAIAVQSDGKIIVGGAFSYADAAGDARVNLARFNANGTLDTTFNFKATSAVDALLIVGNTLYLGGDFTGLSKVGGASTLCNRLAAIDLPSLTITSFNPDVDGEVFALATAGTSLYAGGRFTFVGGTQRIGGAAFNLTTGALTAWDPEARDANAPPPAFQGVINAIATSGSTIYVGGTFTQIGGLSTPAARDNLGAVDGTNGNVLAWDPVVSNGGGQSIVQAIVATPSVIYVGGQFSALNGIATPLRQRVGIGALDPTTGVATAWNPGMVSGAGTVRALVLDGSTMFAGGEFTAMGGATRAKAAGIDITTATITSLTRATTTATAQVASTAGLSNGISVTLAGASPENYNGVQGPITVVDATHFTFPIAGNPTTPATGTITFARNNDATGFNPVLDGDVHSMALNGGATALLMGGNFLKANNVANPAFGGFNKANGATSIAGYVYDTAAVWRLLRQADGKTVVAGDFFLNSGGVFYRALIRLNANDTLDTSWNPVVDGQVVTADFGPIIPPASAPDTVLIGGSFSKVGATSRPRLAAVSLASGAATSFNANVDSVVNKVVVDGTTAYIGGRFLNVGGMARNFVAAVNATTGALASWYPAGGADDFVETLAVDASSVYLGGEFLNVGGQSRPNVAKVAKSNSAVAAWNPVADEAVFGLTVVGNTVYVSGNFSHLGGAGRNFTGAVDATTGNVTAWNPNPDFVVLGVVPSPTTANMLYLHGAFINLNGTQVGNAAAVNNTTGAAYPWFPLMNDAVYDLIPDATRVLLGGVFVDSAGVTRLSLAALTRAGIPDPPGTPVATAGNASASVTFTAPANNGGSAITGYTVVSSPAGGVDSNAGSTALTHSVTGLTNGVTYTFKVTAANANGTGAPSAASNGVTPTAPTVPGPPLNVTATAGNAQASVTFGPPTSNGGSAITGYTVTSSPAGGVDSNAGQTTTTHVVTNLVNGTPYTFTVKATNAVGSGPASAPSNSVTPTAGTPTAQLSPTSLTFPATTVGVASASKTVTLTNNGTATLAITSIAASGDFSQTNSCGSSLPGPGTCNINVVFTPTQVGTRNGTLTVVDNASGSPHTASLTGTGSAAADTTPDPFTFTPALNVAPGKVVTSNAITVTGINAAASITVTGGQYRINGGTATSSPGNVNAGDTVAAVGTAPAAKKLATNVVVTIGGVGGTFTITTEAHTRSDLSGDGKSDLVWRNTSTGAVNAWLMNGLAFLPGTGAIGTVPVGQWVIRGVGDFDGDGKADILWHNTVTGDVNIWFMNGAQIKAGSGTVSNLPASQWQFAGIGDVNGDGKSDIVWRNIASGDVYVWLMNGLAFLPGSGRIGNAPPGVWNLIGVADFNGDGKADLLWHHQPSGSVNVWYLNGAVMTGGGTIAALDPNVWQFGGAGDTNGDGKADIIWRNKNTGDVYVWLVNGIALQPGSGPIGTVPFATWSIIGLADFDGDGRQDLLWRSSTNDVNVWFLDGATLRPGSGAITNVGSTQWQNVTP